MAATDHLSDQFEQGQLFLPWEDAQHVGENRMNTDINDEFGDRMVAKMQAYSAAHQNSFTNRIRRRLASNSVWNSPGR